MLKTVKAVLFGVAFTLLAATFMMLVAILPYLLIAGVAGLVAYAWMAGGPPTEGIPRNQAPEKEDKLAEL